MKEIALKTHMALGCCDFSRVDMIMDSDRNIYVLELNSIPGFTSCSLLPLAARYEGISFNELSREILSLAKYGKRNKCPGSDAFRCLA